MSPTRKSEIGTPARMARSLLSYEINSVKRAFIPRSVLAVPSATRRKVHQVPSVRFPTARKERRPRVRGLGGVLRGGIRLACRFDTRASFGILSLTAHNAFAVRVSADSICSPPLPTSSPGRLLTGELHLSRTSHDLGCRRLRRIRQLSIVGPSQRQAVHAQDKRLLIEYERNTEVVCI